MVTWMDILFCILYLFCIHRDLINQKRRYRWSFFVLKVNKSRRDSNYNKQTGTSTLS